MAIIGRGDDLNNPTVQCSLCKTYVKFRSSGNHKARDCTEAPYTFPRHNKMYLCFMGCNKSFKTRLELMHHLVFSHREE